MIICEFYQARVFAFIKPKAEPVKTEGNTRFLLRNVMFLCSLAVGLKIWENFGGCSLQTAFYRSGKTHQPATASFCWSVGEMKLHFWRRCVRGRPLLAKMCTTGNCGFHYVICDEEKLLEMTKYKKTLNF